ncbi:MAG: 50S ribosomal protein L10 [Candidatus Vogelbacteria bacterium]|nr:50S ribosomal protein L10 [Candidatus Vogelbacteria bacterium]
MAITRQQKETISAKLEQVIREMPAIVFVNFHGLSMAATTELRKALRMAGIGYLVAKKTLLKRVLEQAKLEGTMPALEGEIALAYGADSLAGAQGVYAFEKKYKEMLSIVGGIFEGAFADRSLMTSLATIPSRQTLYAQVANVINSPLQGLVIALNQIAESKNN